MPTRGRRRRIQPGCRLMVTAASTAPVRWSREGEWRIRGRLIPKRCLRDQSELERWPCGVDVWKANRPAPGTDLRGRWPIGAHFRDLAQPSCWMTATRRRWPPRGLLARSWWCAPAGSRRLRRDGLLCLPPTNLNTDISAMPAQPQRGVVRVDGPRGACCIRTSRPALRHSLQRVDNTHARRPFFQYAERTAGRIHMAATCDRAGQRRAHADHQRDTCKLYETFATNYAGAHRRVGRPSTSDRTSAPDPDVGGWPGCRSFPDW
jgi:hypothetical protein